jgi:hypothetical protein
MLRFHSRKRKTKTHIAAAAESDMARQPVSASTFADFATLHVAG